MPADPFRQGLERTRKLLDDLDDADLPLGVYRVLDSMLELFTVQYLESTGVINPPGAQVMSSEKFAEMVMERAKQVKADKDKAAGHAPATAELPKASSPNGKDVTYL